MSLTFRVVDPAHVNALPQLNVLLLKRGHGFLDSEHVQQSGGILSFFVAFSEGKPVGYLHFYISTQPGHPQLYLTSAYTDPAFRKKGVAKELVVHALRYASTRDIHTVNGFGLELPMSRATTRIQQLSERGEKIGGRWIPKFTIGVTHERGEWMGPDSMVNHKMRLKPRPPRKR